MSRVLGAGRMRSPEGCGDGHSGRLSAQRGRAAPGAHQRLPSNPRAFPQLRPFPARPAPRAGPGRLGAGRSRHPGARRGWCPRVGAPVRVQAEFWGSRFGRKGAWGCVEGRRGTPTSASSNLLSPVSAPTWAVLGDPRAVGSEGPFSDSPISSHPHFCGLRGRGQRGEVTERGWLLLGTRPPPPVFLSAR